MGYDSPPFTTPPRESKVHLAGEERPIQIQVTAGPDVDGEVAVEWQVGDISGTTPTTSLDRQRSVIDLAETYTVDGEAVDEIQLSEEVFISILNLVSSLEELLYDWKIESERE